MLDSGGSGRISTARERTLEGRLLTCKPRQTPAHGSAAGAACGTLCSTRSTISLADRMKLATSPTPAVILEDRNTFSCPFCTKSLICICRVDGSFSLAERSPVGSRVSPPRALSRVSRYNWTRSALSDSRLSYAAFYTLSDAERAEEIGCTRGSVAGGARGCGAGVEAAAGICCIDVRSGRGEDVTSAGIRTPQPSSSCSVGTSRSFASTCRWKHFRNNEHSR